MAFSIKQLLALILVAAVGLAALMNPHVVLGRNLVNILTVAILVVFAYGAWTSQGEQRAFRVGFFCWGALYFISFTRSNLGIELGIGDLLSYMYLKLRSASAQRDPFEPSRFLYIGRCLFALLFGLIGGWVTVYFYRQRQRMQRTEA